MSITNNVSALRISKKMTQEEMANIVGISRTALSAIENGTTPNGDTMLKIAKALSTDVEEIFFINDVVYNKHDDEAV